MQKKLEQACLQHVKQKKAPMRSCFDMYQKQRGDTQGTRYASLLSRVESVRQHFDSVGINLDNLDEFSRTELAQKNEVAEITIQFVSIARALLATNPNSADRENLNASCSVISVKGSQPRGKSRNRSLKRA